MTAPLMRHRVFEELRADIMSCVLLPGEQVRESELAKRYGVSKSPIRDALQKLEVEGLVEIVARQGHRISQISIADARDILELRMILEAAAVRRIASDAADEALSNLDRFRKANVYSTEEFAEYNRGFHHHICELSGNGRLAQTMQILMENYDRLCVVSLSTRRTRAEAMQTALADHNSIIDALQERNGAAAAKLSAKHIERSRAQVLQGLSNQPVVA